MGQANKKISFLKTISFFSGSGITWAGMLNNKKGEWLLILQLLIIGAHLLPTFNHISSLQIREIIISKVSGILFLTSGLNISIRSILSLGDNLSPLPFPKEGSILVQNNSYKKCRHPLYKGLIFCSIGICLIKLSILHLILLIALVYVLRNKAKVEEKYLKNKHPEYKDYMNSTPAIIRNLSYLDWN